LGSAFTTIAYGNNLNVWAVGPLVSGTTVYAEGASTFSAASREKLNPQVSALTLLS
jgi:hypothetical protein